MWNVVNIIIPIVFILGGLYKLYREDDIKNRYVWLFVVIIALSQMMKAVFHLGELRPTNRFMKDIPGSISDILDIIAIWQSIVIINSTRRKN